MSTTKVLGSPQAQSKAGAPPADQLLVLAWAGYVAAVAEMGQATHPDKDGESQRRVTACAEVLESHPAHTPVGIAAKLRYLVSGIHDSPAAWKALVEGGSLQDAIVDDSRAKALWDVISEVEALVMAPVVEPDAFADTVAAFENAAPEPLCMPQSPTDAMVQAGAAAAGITLKRFANAYAAAVEAFKGERAA
ncbi:hypothetical protein [Azospirillum sp.]|uniref:hypothetical protein n=1 Tax=Azospirillum sp. TaxID=34012 RepID=UPI002D5E1F29|nr:hypothetical protein [Azospirillum sp.]HYD68494.1 hypothetical protein [Azospirillum sp.]